MNVKNERSVTWSYTNTLFTKLCKLILSSLVPLACFQAQSHKSSLS